MNSSHCVMHISVCTLHFTHLIMSSKDICLYKEEIINLGIRLPSDWSCKILFSSFTNLSMAGLVSDDVLKSSVSYRLQVAPMGTYV